MNHDFPRWEPTYLSWLLLPAVLQVPVAPATPVYTLALFTLAVPILPGPHALFSTWLTSMLQASTLRSDFPNLPDTPAPWWSSCISFSVWGLLSRWVLRPLMIPCSQSSVESGLFNKYPLNEWMSPLQGDRVQRRERFSDGGRAVSRFVPSCLEQSSLQARPLSRRQGPV